VEQPQFTSTEARLVPHTFMEPCQLAALLPPFLKVFFARVADRYLSRLCVNPANHFQNVPKTQDATKRKRRDINTAESIVAVGTADNPHGKGRGA
jgi:hypothetical protein